jgi:hypothetical protein
MLTLMFAKKMITPQDAAQSTLKNISLLPDIIDGLSAKEARVKYSCAKTLLIISLKDPAVLYPYFDFFELLLENNNNILKWTAIDIIGCLAIIDMEQDINRLMQKLYGFLAYGNMITANHAISGLAKIAGVRDDLQAKITEELLKVEGYKYQSGECQNIALGKVIMALDLYANDVSDRSEIYRFVKRQTKNTRNATRKKAEEFLKKRNIS